MTIQISYYYQKTGLDTARREQIRNLLSVLKAAGRIATFSVEDADTAFPTKEAEQALFNRLREFACATR